MTAALAASPKTSMPRQAIRNEGTAAEIPFSAILCPRAKPTDDPKRGDRLFLHKGQWHYVEIKQCESGTINQVRAIKSIPLVVFSRDRSTKRWAALSPSEVARKTLRRQRGQHTEIPFECAALSRSSLPEEVWGTDAELADRLAAALDDPANPKVKSIMQELLTEIRCLCEKYRIRLKSLLGLV